MHETTDKMTTRYGGPNKNCHQDILSRTSATNIDVAVLLMAHESWDATIS